MTDLKFGDLTDPDFVQLCALSVLEEHYSGKNIRYLYGFACNDDLKLAIIDESDGGKLVFLTASLFGVEPKIEIDLTLSLKSIMTNLKEPRKRMSGGP
jgi:hypothetical protein